MEEKTSTIADRQQEIRDKGFDINTSSALEYGKIKVGVKTLEDAILSLGTLKAGNRRYTDKSVIIKALAENDLAVLREVSNYFYRVSGIYQRACNYFATMYRYDWYVVPENYGNDVKEEKVISEFIKILNFLDNSYVKKVCGDIALNVVRNGAYYGYIVDSPDSIMLQELPIGYCRQRYYSGNKPVIEFNMRFFDDKFSDVSYRLKVLSMFPKEFSKGYVLYKQGKLIDDCASSPWAQGL